MKAKNTLCSAAKADAARMYLESGSFAEFKLKALAFGTPRRLILGVWLHDFKKTRPILALCVACALFFACQGCLFAAYMVLGSPWVMAVLLSAACATAVKLAIDVASIDSVCEQLDFADPVPLEGVVARILAWPLFKAFRS